MSTPRSLRGPARAAALGFLGLMALAGAVALARSEGLLGPDAARRLLGLVLGLSAVATGNLLPKLRPLRRLGAAPADALAAERFAGWLLVLAGLGQLALFAVAPLPLARALAAILGAGALLAIGASWAWLGWEAARRPRGGTAPDPGAPPGASDQVAVWLVFALVQVLATACAAAFADGDAWGARLLSWMPLGFWGLYAVLFAALGRRRPSR